MGMSYITDALTHTHTHALGVLAIAVGTDPSNIRSTSPHTPTHRHAMPKLIAIIDALRARKNRNAHTTKCSPNGPEQRTD